MANKSGSTSLARQLRPEWLLVKVTLSLAKTLLTETSIASEQSDSMLKHKWVRLFSIFVVACAIGICFSLSVGLAESPKKAPTSRSVHDADPQHLWNRLHGALFIRVGPNGRAYGQDRLEPLLWPQSKHLLEPRSNSRAVAVLQEFLKNDGEKLAEDPLKRALLQRDLWLVFNWLEGNHSSFSEPLLKEEAVRVAQQRLRQPLAAVIGRLALNPKEIRNLSDNYAAAVKSREFARNFDRKQPDKPYLPPGLFTTDGPWVCVGRTDGRTAPQHLRDDNNSFTNSVFLVFLHLPEGRAATVNYLKQLRSFAEPLLIQNPRTRKGGGEGRPEKLSL